MLDVRPNVVGPHLQRMGCDAIALDDDISRDGQRHEHLSAHSFLRPPLPQHVARATLDRHRDRPNAIVGRGHDGGVQGFDSACEFADTRRWGFDVATGTMRAEGRQERLKRLGSRLAGALGEGGTLQGRDADLPHFRAGDQLFSQDRKNE
jgi:hypothetical protein